MSGTLIILDGDGEPPDASDREALRVLRRRGYVIGMVHGGAASPRGGPPGGDVRDLLDPAHIAAGTPATPRSVLLRRAVLGSAEPETGHAPCPPFIAVADAAGDVDGARAAGAVTVVLRAEDTGALAAANADISVVGLAALVTALEGIDDLATIQRLQFGDRERAERFARLWFHRHMDLDVDDVRLTPHVVSLNSFNGTMRVHGEPRFFKTHVEEHGIVTEYYNAETLHAAGYNTVRPLGLEQREGCQMAVYPVVSWPVMFDAMRSVETGRPSPVDADELVAAERRECDRLLDIYRATSERSTADEHARAPIHQLFWHRITGGRLAAFYADADVPMPDGSGERVPMTTLFEQGWVINGVEHDALGALLDRARETLRPGRPMLTVIGHGDAHFGNVFLEDLERYLYFDPAFGGRHSPLLDIVKPLFHNVFATWLYFPEASAAGLGIRVERRCGTMHVTVDDRLHTLRQRMLDTKIEHLVRPLVGWLREEDALPADWEEILRLALMCCPLLTRNLLDSATFPPAITWLGLTWAVRMGSRGPSPELEVGLAPK